MTSDPAATPGFAVPGMRLSGVVCGLPAQCIGNDAFATRFGAEAVAEVTGMTGVETRYWVANGQTASDLCLAAARRLLERLDWAAASVDALIFVSQTPDQRLPATACRLHARLGLSTRCQAFDVNLGCSGYVYGLWLAAAMLAAGCRRILLLAGDASSRLVDPTDRATALLFGDAGSASALEHRQDAPLSHFVLGTDGTGAAHLAIPPGAETLHMAGGEVFGFTLRAVPALLRDTMACAGRAIEEIDAFVLHQANRFMLRHIAKKLAIPAARMPINIDRYGNTSSASIPLLLCTDLAARITGGPTRALLAGFGVGFSWAGVSLTLAPLRCAEVVTA